jgi:hypothetical protein
MGLMGTLLLGAFYLSSSGATLSKPDEKSDLSMRNVQNRRTHFMRYYAFGK